MNIAELRELLELITERNITEFELEEEGVRLRIKKGGDVGSAVALAVDPHPTGAALPEASTAMRVPSSEPVPPI